MCLCARIDGRSIGIVGIAKIVRVLIQSFGDETSDCQGHASSTYVFAVKASRWVRDLRRRPFSVKHATFVPVRDDRCWTLFLVGESASFNRRIVFSCLECAVTRASPMSIIIGYSQVSTVV
jgi:hypothetical protein